MKDNELLPDLINDRFSLAPIVEAMPEHKEMLQVIEKGLPEIARATSLFNKTQSQFMDNMLTVNHHEPLRNLRQILAETNKTKEALEEAHIKCLKKKCEIEIKKKAMNEETCELRAKLIGVEIMELEFQISATMRYVSGAIRKLANYQIQYDSILESMDVKNFNEIDFEKHEERYHIKKAFAQGLNAARARGGMIDEGNLIYLSDIGINCGSAQKEISKYLILERDLLSKGLEPNNELVLEFLNNMANKYQGCAERYAKAKGMVGTMTELPLLKSGDMRLIKNKPNTP